MRGVAPAVVLYNPALTLSMLARPTASSGVNAAAHCVEGLEAAWAGERPAAEPDLAPAART